MVDVLHYYMEEDYRFSSSEEADARSNLRKLMYKNLYQREYKYFIPSKTNSRATASGIDFDDLDPVDPTAGPTKSYFPPTDFNPEAPNPFGDVLDAPLGNN